MYKNIHNTLLQWYKIQGRHHLPWRDCDNLYHIYISEVMLQQTQVSRVQEYFFPNFLQKYPTLQALSNAKLDEVLVQWSGLGYYSRARNLHKTAQLTAQNGLPRSTKELEKLPGIGKYTASAICSFGLGQAIPVVDTNISRVLKRFFALVEVKDHTVWQYAHDFLNNHDPTAHNLALMDLGSIVCTPNDPFCERCPLQNSCQGKHNPTLYIKKKKISYEKLELFFGVWIEDGKIALVKSTSNLYQGMYQLPNIDPLPEDKIGSFQHSYTKYKITANLYKGVFEIEDVKWIDLQDLDQIPLASMMKKALKLLKKEQLLQ